MRRTARPSTSRHQDPGPAWHALSDGAQTALAQQALHRASLIVAEQADGFAREFAAGALQDRGAAEALRLFAALLRETAQACLPAAGHA